LITVTLWPATWLSNMNGPTQIGLVPKFVPSFCNWVGDSM
jgi:hypothetical protein